ncbi:MAG: alpha-glycosidase [Anaerolineaceae bacterium]|nr:alpha-glycosidase [Anaerolineaceae bacterium]
MAALPAWTAGVHHDGSIMHISNPLPALNETVSLTLRTPANAPINHIFLRAIIDGEYHRVEMTISSHNDVAKIWTADLKLPQAHVDYCFKLMTTEGSYYYTARGIYRSDTPDSDYFTLLAGYQAPAWVHDAIFYQIFPDRFNNGDPSNDTRPGETEVLGHKSTKPEWGELPTPWEKSGSMDFFGGDLQGITNRLDYLQDLGVNALYLCPIFKAGTNHKYDIQDFWQIDKHFGGNEALVALREELDRRGMHIILDITTNHIGNGNPWYLDAKDNPNASTADFFDYDPETGKIDTWLGVPLLIKLNYKSQLLRDRMYRDKDAALRYWLNEPYRIDGWRLDVANMTGNLRENQLDHEVWREMRPYIKNEHSEAYLLGEYFMDGTPHLTGDELDASMNYTGFNVPIRRWIGGEDVGVADGNPYGDTELLPSDAVAGQWQRFMAAVPYAISLQQFNQLGSHDTTRILHVAGEDKALVRVGLALLIGFPGTPCIYYGDEIGMTGGKDPDNRRCMPWDESQWDTNMLAYYRKLLSIRKSSSALKYGGFQMLFADGDLLAYQRHTPDQTLIVVGYRGIGTSPSYQIPAWQGGLVDGTQLKDLLSGEVYSVANGMLPLSGLEHGQALILELQR